MEIRSQDERPVSPAYPDAFPELRFERPHYRGAGKTTFETLWARTSIGRFSVPLLGMRGRLGVRQPICDQVIHGRIESEAEVSSRNLAIDLRIIRDAVVPVYDTVGSCVDRSLRDG